MTTEMLMEDVVVQSVLLGGDATLEITYAERREQQEHASQMRVIQIDMTHDLDTLHELNDLLLEIVDRGQEILRRPQDFEHLKNRRGGE